MKLIKNQLTFAETLEFVNGIIDAVFTQDEQGNDISYSPASLQPLIQSTFVEMYTDYIFVEDFDENFANYMSVNIDDFNYDINGSGFNRTQYDGMIKAINDGIEFRKQKMLHKSALDELLNELTKVVKGLGNSINFEDVATLLPQLAKLGENFNQKEVINQILKSMPQDHKKKESKKKNEE